MNHQPRPALPQHRHAGVAHASVAHEGVAWVARHLPPSLWVSERHRDKRCRPPRLEGEGGEGQGRGVEGAQGGGGEGAGWAVRRSRAQECRLAHASDRESYAHCNTLQYTATHERESYAHCNDLQYTATRERESYAHCNTLKYTATHERASYLPERATEILGRAVVESLLGGHGERKGEGGWHPTVTGQNLHGSYPAPPPPACPSRPCLATPLPLSQSSIFN